MVGALMREVEGFKATQATQEKKLEAHGKMAEEIKSLKARVNAQDREQAQLKTNLANLEAKFNSRAARNR
jgi:predicted RNase H-like nuclease (RuvC/YqgF family)